MGLPFDIDCIISLVIFPSSESSAAWPSTERWTNVWRVKSDHIRSRLGHRGSSQGSLWGRCTLYCRYVSICIISSFFLNSKKTWLEEAFNILYLCMSFLLRSSYPFVVSSVKKINLNTFFLAPLKFFALLFQFSLSITL